MNHNSTKPPPPSTTQMSAATTLNTSHFYLNQQQQQYNTDNLFSSSPSSLAVGSMIVPPPTPTKGCQHITATTSAQKNVAPFSFLASGGSAATTTMTNNSFDEAASKKSGGDVDNKRRRSLPPDTLFWTQLEDPSTYQDVRNDATSNNIGLSLSSSAPSSPTTTRSNRRAFKRLRRMEDAFDNLSLQQSDDKQKIQYFDAVPPNNHYLQQQLNNDACNNSLMMPLSANTTATIPQYSRLVPPKRSSHGDLIYLEDMHDNYAFDEEDSDGDDDDDPFSPTNNIDNTIPPLFDSGKVINPVDEKIEDIIRQSRVKAEIQHMVATKKKNDNSNSMMIDGLMLATNTNNHNSKNISNEEEKMYINTNGQTVTSFSKDDFHVPLPAIAQQSPNICSSNKSQKNCFATTTTTATSLQATPYHHQGQPMEKHAQATTTKMEIGKKPHHVRSNSLPDSYCLGSEVVNDSMMMTED